MRDKLQSLFNLFRRGARVPQAFDLAYEAQLHELEITKHFTQNGQTLLPNTLQPVVPVNVVLCFTNRCGSNWLAALLNATGLIGLADEYFNAPRLIRTCHEKGVSTLSDAIKMQATDSSLQLAGSFITKLSWDQLFFFAKKDIIPQMMPNTKYILMHRGDRVAQALSMQVAEQTGQWTSQFNSGKNGERNLDEISDESIQHSMDEIALKYEQFQRYFKQMGITPVEVTYEDVVADPLGETTRLINELELNPAGKSWQLDESKVKLTKQADAASDKRVAAFTKNMHNSAPNKPQGKTEAA